MHFLPAVVRYRASHRIPVVQRLPSLQPSCFLVVCFLHTFVFSINFVPIYAQGSLLRVPTVDGTLVHVLLFIYELKNYFLFLLLHLLFLDFYFLFLFIFPLFHLS